MFGLTLIPFEPVSVPSIRYAYRQRSRIESGGPFEWPSGIPANQKQLTPAEVRRRCVAPLIDQIAEPFSAAWMPESLRQYDRVTRDQYLRAQGVSEAALHMMNLGYTPVARFRSFLDVLHENAVDRELSRRAGTENEHILKIDGGNDRLPRVRRRLGRPPQIWLRGSQNRTRRARRTRLFSDRRIRRVRRGGLRCVRCSLLDAEVGRVFTRSPVRETVGDRRLAL